MNADLHDTYAADYDAEVLTHDCHIAEVLFGLNYEFIRPGQRLLDAGIGSGISSALFAKAGLEVQGMDFSPAMLDICRAKGFAADLKQHDLRQVPWPYAPDWFDHLVCCGVMHFLSELDGIFGEARRVLAASGLFAFTTRLSAMLEVGSPDYERQTSGDFEIFSHASGYIEMLLARHSLSRLKRQRCFVGDDLFLSWIVQNG